jgi:ParB family chromosome partitioning protein
MSDVHHRLEFGDLVVDRELDASDRDIAAVVNTPSKRAEDWTLNGGGTVATDNPGYSARDPIAAVVYLEDLRENHAHYSGVAPLRLRDLSKQSVPWYAFPENRLIKTSSLGPQELPIDSFRPSPYHARNFDAASNREYINEIRDRGRPDPALFGRVVDDGDEDTPPTVELINGHKRLWASAVAGLDTVPCYCCYFDAERSHRAWAHRHLDDYTGEQRAVAVNRLREDWGAALDDVLPTATDGGHTGGDV